MESSRRLNSSDERDGWESRQEQSDIQRLLNFLFGDAFSKANKKSELKNLQNPSNKKPSDK